MRTVCMNSVERCCISIKCQRMTLGFFKSYPYVNFESVFYAFYIIYCSENRLKIAWKNILKIQITPYGIFFY